jgi:hypothetical protein
MNGTSNLSELLLARLPGAAAAVTISGGNSFHPKCWSSLGVSF